MLESHDRVARLRLHAGQAGASVRLAETLAGASLHPPELPVDAILLIRRLDVTWAVEQAPGARAAQLQRRVGDTLARAVRPALEPVPADADVIVFSSRAEMLACLALDGLARQGGWWWALLGASFVPGRFVAAWTEAPELLPAVLGLLAGRDQLRPVLAQVSAREGRRLQRAVIEAFGLPGLLPGLEQVPDAAPLPGRGAPAELPAGPWQAWSAELRVAWLPPPVALFAGVALGLQRAESSVRGLRFAHEVSLWAAAVATSGTQAPIRDTDDTRLASAIADTAAPLAPEPAPPEHATFAPMSAPALAVVSLEPRAVDERSRVAEPDEAAIAAMPAPLPLRTIEPPDRIAVAPASVTGDPPAAPPFADPEAPNSVDISRTREVRAEAPIDATPPIAALAPACSGPELAAPTLTPARNLADSSVALPVTGVKTALGGSFYLINVALALDLYGDFTRPLHPGSEVSLWDVLAELTARLLAAPAPGDALWSVLAGLAGRPRRTPIAGDPRMCTPDDFAPPAAAWPPERREAWFSQLEQRVHDLLAPAIRLPPATWLRQPAEIRLCETGLDIHYALADHPIEVRLAALDRDPGWIPAAGRDVRFRYDA